ncbi:MAG: CPBP family intramembrane metalloprotease [Phycisphaerae bacterium]|nr:CPBP family intramembrane metalloprotease [Phycisphaerae bacterium]
MDQSSAPPPPRRDSYARQTHRPLVCLAFIAPLLLLFHAGTAYYGSSLLAPRDLGRLLKYFGATAAYLPALLIVAVLLVQHLAKRDPWELAPVVVVGVTVESLLWTVPLVVMNLLADRLVPQAATAENASRLAQEVLVAMGAGIYEEFIFRLALISLALFLFVDLLALPKEAVAVCAVIVSGCLFSLYHFLGGVPEGEIAWKLFVFRTLAGVYLGGLFVTRGLAVAIGTHAFFNRFVVLARALGAG